MNQDLITHNGHVIGYLIDFQGHGIFHSDGKMKEPLTPEEISRHNNALAQLEWAALEQTGRGIFYLTQNVNKQGWQIGDWMGVNKYPVSVRFSTNNWRVKRTDCWFMHKGQRYWGVNLGDNDIVRVRRIK